MIKLLCVVLIMGVLQSCDPYGFGFKNNPAFVINEAYQAVVALDHETFVDVSGKEALCLYGNVAGISYLRSNLRINAEEVEIKPKLIPNSNKHTATPQFVGYWSYYHERYQVDILDKASKNELLKVVVECNYGFEGSKKPEYAKPMKTKKYKIKECRLIKVVPSKFAALPMRPECIPLKVDL